MHLDGTHGFLRFDAGLSFPQAEEIVAYLELLLFEELIQISADRPAHMVRGPLALSSASGGPFLDANVRRDEEHALHTAQRILLRVPGKLLRGDRRQEQNQGDENDPSAGIPHFCQPAPAAPYYTSGRRDFSGCAPSGRAGSLGEFRKLSE